MYAVGEQRMLHPEPCGCASAVPGGHLPPVTRKGLSLLEVLVAAAIVAVVAGIALAASATGRKRALSTHDTSNLRQVGQAHALYQSVTDSEGWFSTPPLVQYGVLPKETVASPHDRSAVGVANRVRLERYPGPKNPPTDYKDSYLAYDMTAW